MRFQKAVNFGRITSYSSLKPIPMPPLLSASSQVSTRIRGNTFANIHPEVVSQTVEWIDKWAVKIKSWEKTT
jgi:hypothetical protein